MPRKRKRILVLYDLPEIVDAHQNIAYISQNNDRPTERDVVRTLSQLVTTPLFMASMTILKI